MTDQADVPLVPSPMEILQQQQLTILAQLQQLQIPRPHAAIPLAPDQNFHDDNDHVSLVTRLTLPSFWKTNPELWFYQIEAKFRRANIRADCTKYDAVLEALDISAITEISDVIQATPDVDKYNFIKASLIKRFSDSTERQLHKLLSEIELGEQKPTQLLRSMRDLAKGRATDELLKAKWLALLPGPVHNTLKVLPKASLNELADVADSIMENTTYPHVMATNMKQQSNDATALDKRLSNIEKQLADLSFAVQKLTDSKSNQPHRFRPRSKSPNRTGECFYHRRYADKAKKCTTPCTYKQEN